MLAQRDHHSSPSTSAIPARVWREQLMLVGIWLATVLPGLGLREPWPADEPRFVLMARQMLASGRWLFPERGSELYSDKPPLFMWIIALLEGAGVPGRIAFLLPAALMLLLSALLVHDLARRWRHCMPLAAGLLMLITIQAAMTGRQGVLDGTLLGFTTLGFYGLLRHLVWGPAWPWCWLGCLAMGAGVITKGVGFLPLLALLPWLVAVWGRPQLRTGRLWWPGWLLALLALCAPILAWLLPMLAAVGDDPARLAYRDDLLLRQTLERATDSWHHLKWFGFYVVEAIPVQWFPASWIAVAKAAALWRRLRRREAQTVILLGWLAVVVLLFSLSPGKRQIYLLPALPAMALLAGRGTPLLLRRTWTQASCRWLVLVAGAVAVLAALLAWATPLLEWRALRRLDDFSFDPRPMLLVTGVALLLLGLWLRRRPATLLIAAMLVCWQAIGWWLTPTIDAERSSAGAWVGVRRELPPDIELGLVNWTEHLLLQADRPVVDWGWLRPVDEQLELARSWLDDAPTQRALLMQERQAAELAGPQERWSLGRYNRRDWVLVRRPAAGQ